MTDRTLLLVGRPPDEDSGRVSDAELLARAACDPLLFEGPADANLAVLLQRVLDAHLDEEDGTAWELLHRITDADLAPHGMRRVPVTQRAALGELDTTLIVIFP